DLHHPFHAIHVSTVPRTVRDLCRAYLPLLPEGALFSHQTAAALLGIPLPGSPIGEPLHVSVEFPRSPPQVVA
ncbi:MAG: hypothetical protein JWO56_2313, partial [Acidobacteria bacterium]|nr:hypothetical protein [Acidobacteriota bacterium]